MFTLIGYSSQTQPNRWLEKEYYWDGRKEQRQKTDSDYANDLKKFLSGYNVRAIYIDPSAVSFKVELSQQGFSGVIDAKNEVLDGIRFHSNMLMNGGIRICDNCTHTIHEYGTYRGDDKACARGEDKPKKDNDHCMDSIRYALFTHFFGSDGHMMEPHELDALRDDCLGILPYTKGTFFDNALEFNQIY